MSDRVDVMISSTARDLPEYRRQAMDACVRQGMFPIMMEHLPAMDEDAISASLAMVDEAEIYLGIFAGRYGYIPQGYPISITEMEYNRAVERGIPRLIFLMADDLLTQDDGLPAEPPEKTARLEAFKARLQQEQIVNFFTSPADLRAQVINSLSHYHKRATRTFHRATLIPMPPEPYIVHPYTLLETGNLFGRRDELHKLDDWANARNGPFQSVAVMNLVSMGGMGKSSLAWKFFHQTLAQSNAWDGALWWSFYDSEAHYENFITRTLAYITGKPEDNLRSMSLSARASQLINLLDQRPIFIVLDGFERTLIAYHRERQTQENAPLLSLPDSGGIQARLRKTSDPRTGAFLRQLATVRASRILTSTRLYPDDLETSAGHSIAGTSALMLKGLADEDALALWYSFGLGGTQDALIELFHSFDNYPLLIRALAGEVSRYRRAPGDFDSWRAANPQFNPFALPMVQRQSHILTYALNGLSEPELHILRTIAAFSTPAGYGTLADLLVGESFQDENELDGALTELEDRGLLGWDREANRYDLHPVVRGIVWRGLDEGAQYKLYDKLRAFLGALPSVDDWRKVTRREDLSATLELYHTLIGLRRYDEAHDLLANKLYRPLRYRFSDGGTLLALLRALFPDGETIPRLSEAGKQAWALNALAQAYQMIGQPGQAVPLFERSNNLKEKAHYTVDLSSGLRDLAYAERLTGGLRYSEVAARRALLIDREDNNLLLEAISLQVLGLALAARGEYEDSALALDRSLDLADRTNANRAYNHQAMRALWKQDYQAALEWSDKAIEYSRGRRLESALILARRLHGEAALKLGDLSRAEEYLHKALSQARAANLMEEEIAALIALAELARCHKQFDTAWTLLNDVRPAVEEGPYTLFNADACNVLAAIERDLGNLAVARESAIYAYQLAWCDGPPYAYAYGLGNATAHLAALNQPLPNLTPFDPTSTMPMVKVEISPTHES